MSKKKTSFDDANFKVVLKKFLRDWSALEYENNPPSALLQEKRYAQYGIKLPLKLHYEYKMPFGLESSYDLLFWLVAVDLKKRLRSGKDLVDYLEESIDYLRDKDKKLLSVYRAVSPQQLNMIIDWLGQISSDQMIAEIKRLNPELTHIKTDGKTSGVVNPVLDFVQGVAYGFAPKDIELCLTSKHEELQKVAENPRYQKVRFGHYTTPEHYEAMLLAEQQIQQIEQAKQNNGKE